MTSQDRELVNTTLPHLLARRARMSPDRGGDAGKDQRHLVSQQLGGL